MRTRNRSEAIPKFYAMSEFRACRLAPRYRIGIGRTKKLGTGLARQRIRTWVVESLESRAMLSTIAVSNTGDTGPGTLRAAIEQANLDAAQDTITFTPSVTGTITLSTALPDLSAGMNIVGPGSSALTVARNGAGGTPLFGIFTVSAGAQVVISGLTITSGLAATSGGGIANSGILSVKNSVISNNTAGSPSLEENANGGGIANSGTLTVTDSTVSGNSVVSEAASAGGGIDNSGTLSVVDSTFSSNDASGVFFNFSGTGGGINNTGTLLVTGSTFSSNLANEAGGGIANFGKASIVSSIFSGNTGDGIDNSGTVTVTSSTFRDNVIYGSGGGIDNSGSLTVTDSAFRDNTASFYTLFHVPIAGRGGGIANSGTLSVMDSTFNGNSADYGGGIEIDSGTVNVTDSTYNGNSASVEGGGIDNSGTVSITYSTFSGNSASMGGGIANSAKASIVDTIVAGNTESGTSAASDIGGDVTGSYDLIGTGGSGGIIGGQDGNIVLSSLTGLGLSALGDNGGPTQTMALLPGSPAINAGVSVPSVTTDQRGVPRPQGNAPDIGAFEVQFPPTVLRVERHGVHLQPTTLLVILSQPMDAIPADTLANYSLVSAGPDHRLGTRDDRPIRIRSVQYDTVTNTVTLRPFHRLPLRGTYRLTIRGIPTTGLTGTDGLYLDGAGTGQEGTNYVATINRKSLVLPIQHQGRTPAAVFSGREPR
jgi:hypothetical protein